MKDLNRDVGTFSNHKQIGNHDLRYQHSAPPTQLSNQLELVSLLVLIMYPKMSNMCVKKMGRPASFATSYMIGREDKRTNNRTMLPTLKNNAAAGYQGPVKRELLKDAGLTEKGDLPCM